MGFWKNLFGSKKAAPPAAQQPDNATNITVFDSYGREMSITREEWRRRVLPEAVKQKWDRPQELLQLVLRAIDDGLVEEVLDAARHLHAMDSSSAHAAAALGFAYLKLGRSREAENVLTDYLRGSEDGVVLATLAKVFAAQKNEEKAEATLWRALEVDPNQDNGLRWFIARHQERGGVAAAEEAVARIAALPGSWRAALWMARGALERGERQQAMEIYKSALSQLSAVPADALQQISGDLGQRGHLQELLELTAPRFDPPKHGIAVGNNLLKAYVDLEQVDSAQQLLKRLYGYQRPDWRQTLQYWERTIEDKLQGFGPLELKDQPLTTFCICVQAPLWAHEKAKLLPGRASGAPRVAVMAASCKLATPPAGVVVQRANAEGRLGRALALHLADSIELETSADGFTLLPLLARGESAGFAVYGEPWANEALIDMVKRQSMTLRLLAHLHLDTRATPWRIELKVLDVESGTTLAEKESTLDPAEPGPAVERLESALLEAVLQLPGVAPRQRPEWTRPPSGARLGAWLSAYEQAAAVLCAAGEAPRVSLYGPRDLVDGLFAGCLASPASAPWRMLLLGTLSRFKRIDAALLGEYQDRAQRLQSEHRIEDVAQAAELAHLTREIFAID